MPDKDGAKTEIFLKVRCNEIPLGILSEKTIGDDSNLLPLRIFDDFEFLNPGCFFYYYYYYYGYL